MTSPSLVAIVPAAGIGTRMQSTIPKQYLMLNGKTILEHTLLRLLAFDAIEQVIVSLHPEDSWFADLSIAKHTKVTTVVGGDSRAKSVMNALANCDADSWALVHDAARPCVRIADIQTLVETCQTMPEGGGILASPVRDTMKRGHDGNGNECVKETVDREHLWHALTPQLFNANQLLNAYRQAAVDGISITDEASAMEHAGQPVRLVSSHPGNIKITHPDDLDLASFYLQQES
jgi:2-C-methyl-D-erythritol 4-phosphate cytidylyltransferase